MICDFVFIYFTKLITLQIIEINPSIQIKTNRLGVVLPQASS